MCLRRLKYTNAIHPLFLFFYLQILLFILFIFFKFNTVLLLFNPGLPRRLRATNLLWKGKTQSAINLLQDDVLVADPGTKYDFFHCGDISVFMGKF